jgi:hypothetical protein
MVRIRSHDGRWHALHIPFESVPQLPKAYAKYGDFRYLDQDKKLVAVSTLDVSTARAVTITTGARPDAHSTARRGNG